jgi:hypothetical protein
MEALVLTRKDYEDGLEKIQNAVKDNTSYLDQFEISFPQGLNTASALEVCRCLTDGSLEAKLKLTRICITGKNVTIKCPNGDKESFCMANQDDSFDAFDIFAKEPFALMALSDCIYGYLLKKSLRPSKSLNKDAKE